jgi:hypothetical protein
LAADFTGQVSEAQLLVQLDNDRVLMVAEQACKSGRQRFPLLEVSTVGWRTGKFSHLSGALRLPARLLTLSL